VLDLIDYKLTICHKLIARLIFEHRTMSHVQVLNSTKGNARHTSNNNSYTKELSYRRDSAGRRSLRRLRLWDYSLWYQSKVHMRLSISEYRPILTYILSRTVCKISRSIN